MYPIKRFSTLLRISGSSLGAIQPHPISCNEKEEGYVGETFPIGLGRGPPLNPYLKDAFLAYLRSPQIPEGHSR